MLIVDDAASAVLLARALVAGGLKAIEITMRTPAALDAVRAVAAEVEGAFVGAGTILNPAHFQAAVDAGSSFIVSPGTTRALLDAAEYQDSISLSLEVRREMERFVAEPDDD